MRLTNTSQVGLQYFPPKNTDLPNRNPRQPCQPCQPQADLQGHLPLFHLQHGRPEKDGPSLLTGRSQVGKNKQTKPKPDKTKKTKPKQIPRKRRAELTKATVPGSPKVTSQITAFLLWRNVSKEVEKGQGCHIYQGSQHVESMERRSLSPVVGIIHGSVLQIREPRQ